MYLYLDTTERDGFRVALVKNGKIVKDKTVSSARAHSEKLLATVNRLLVQSQMSVKDIAGIAVVRGPGSFTSLRIGVAAANALSFALAVPVVGVSKEVEPKKLARFFSKKGNPAIVLPEYGGEPHITMKMKD